MTLTDLEEHMAASTARLKKLISQLYQAISQLYDFMKSRVRERTALDNLQALHEVILDDHLGPDVTEAYHLFRA